MIAIETSEHLAHSASEAIKTFTFFNHNTATWQLVAVYRLALQVHCKKRCSVVFWNTQNTSESLGTAERPKKPTQVYSLPPTWVPTLKIEIGDDDHQATQKRGTCHSWQRNFTVLCCCSCDDIGVDTHSRPVRLRRFLHYFQPRLASATLLT